MTDSREALYGQVMQMFFTEWLVPIRTSLQQTFLIMYPVVVSSPLSNFLTLKIYSYLYHINIEVER